MSRSSLYRMLNRENFPKPVVLGPADSRGASIRWRSDEVHTYIETLPREKIRED
jgi:predicted DNA-binding transcriptional regulator AlpA